MSSGEAPKRAPNSLGSQPLVIFRRGDLLLALNQIIQVGLLRGGALQQQIKMQWLPVFHRAKVRRCSEVLADIALQRDPGILVDGLDDARGHERCVCLRDWRGRRDEHQRCRREGDQSSGSEDLQPEGEPCIQVLHNMLQIVLARIERSSRRGPAGTIAIQERPKMTAINSPEEQTTLSVSRRDIFIDISGRSFLCCWSERGEPSPHRLGVGLTSSRDPKSLSSKELQETRR